MAFTFEDLQRPTVSLSGGIPAVSRAISLISGLIRQMSLDAYRGASVVRRRRFLHRPDPSPNTSRAWFVGNHVEDYLMHGNAVHLITSRDGSGLPSSAMWLPAQWVGVTMEWPVETGLPEVAYWLNGRRLPSDDVVHVRRGADRWNPWRGVGIVEQHLIEFGKLSKQQTHEESAYTSSGVPSVAVITPNAALSQDEADEAKKQWMEKFQRREPVILPSGTEVKPLAWSPTDSQMVEAHQMSLTDVANMFNLDGSWLGADRRGMEYHNISTRFIGLVRETLGGIMDDFEQIWGDAWLPLNEELKFHLNEILVGDLAEEVDWIAKALDAGLIDINEGRNRIDYPPMSEQAAGSVDDRDEARGMTRRAGADLKGEES